MATTQVFLPGKFHGQRSLVGYGHRGQKCRTRQSTPTHALTDPLSKPLIQSHYLNLVQRQSLTLTHTCARAAAATGGPLTGSCRKPTLTPVAHSHTHTHTRTAPLEAHTNPCHSLSLSLTHTHARTHARAAADRPLTGSRSSGGHPGAASSSEPCTRPPAAACPPRCRCAWAAACTCSLGTSPGAACSVWPAPRSKAVSPGCSWTSSGSLAQTQGRRSALGSADTARPLRTLEAPRRFWVPDTCAIIYTQQGPGPVWELHG